MVMKKYCQISLFFLLASCATSGPERLEQQLIAIGLPSERASCLTNELDDRLNRREINELSSFLDGVNRASTPGETLDALLSIDDPNTSKAVASAGIACAFQGISDRL